jgi:hypothetical protein
MVNEVVNPLLYRFYLNIYHEHELVHAHWNKKMPKFPNIQKSSALSFLYKFNISASGKQFM